MHMEIQVSAIFSFLGTISAFYSLPSFLGPSFQVFNLSEPIFAGPLYQWSHTSSHVTTLVHLSCNNLELVKMGLDFQTIFIGYFWIIFVGFIFVLPFQIIFVGIKISQNLCCQLNYRPTSWYFFYPAFWVNILRPFKRNCVFCIK